MSDDSRLEKLINQCKSNDVDAKVDAVTKLQHEFESGILINDPEGLISVLKTCLRTSNQLLVAATVSALPPLLPLLIKQPPPSTNSIPNPRPAHQVSSSSSSNVPGSSSFDTSILRQVLAAFLPAGGVVERLGDARERTREKARETLVVLGGLAFRSNGTNSTGTKTRDGKATETPLATFERYLRENGLGSKVWRSREQAILALVQIRRAHHLFPVRPYLPHLVDTLEDTDAHVRECSRVSVVELFTGPGVSDAARADFKKEMTKKGVRKAIVDDVLAKLLSGSIGGSFTPTSQTRNSPSEGSEGDGASNRKEYIPPSVALMNRRPTTGPALATGNGAGPSSVPRTVSHRGVKEGPPSRPASRAASEFPPTPTIESSPDVKPVYITSTRDLETEFQSMQKSFDGRETEHNWAAREQAIIRVRGMIKGEVYSRYSETFIACLKDGFVQWSLKALASLRTTLSCHASSLYAELVATMGTALDPFCDTLLSNLLRMAGFTKKIIAQQTQSSVTTIISLTSAQPRTVLPLLWTTLQEKTVQARTFVVAHLKTYLEVHGYRSRNAIEASGGQDILEKCIRRALADPNPAVRERARVCFWVFDDVWNERGQAVLGSLDAIARKQVEKACPNPGAMETAPPVTPSAKKSSVAAAIAASRAKAKAIATAPPTLRHQATSTSQIARATSPPMRRAVSPSLRSTSSHRSTSPLSHLTTPPSPRRAPGVGSGAINRSVSASAVPTTGLRSPPSSTRATSPTSPSTSTDNSTRKRTTSPLAHGSPNRGTLRRAMETALPVSPPTRPRVISPPTFSLTSNNTQLGSNPPHRKSSVFPDLMDFEDESLLLATGVPLPENSDSESEDLSTNMLSFSSPFEMFPPIPPATALPSPPGTQSPQSNSSKPPLGTPGTFSMDSSLVAGDEITPVKLVVEDVLRARAEQAESAAERLLELVEPEDSQPQQNQLQTPMPGGRVTPKSKVKPAPIPIVHQQQQKQQLLAQRQQMLPRTPDNRGAAIIRQAAAFRDSPAANGSSAKSLVGALTDRRHETGWWLKRMSTLRQNVVREDNESGDDTSLLHQLLAVLEQGQVGVPDLQKLALLCVRNPVLNQEGSSELSPNFTFPPSPSPFVTRTPPTPDMWMKNKIFDRLFRALMEYLQPNRTEEQIEYGLIVQWEMLEHQALLLEGKEAETFSKLLTIRYCNKPNVLEATNTIRDALTARVDPVYGLTTVHASLKAFQFEAAPSSASEINAEVKGATYAFGLIAIGKFILRLPAEVLEDELPRIKGTLISALNDVSALVIRESAAAAIIAAQLVLRDERQLFELLDGLADEKKNLLTYLFDKHGARVKTKVVVGGGVLGSPFSGPPGMDRLQREMARLDTRTSTPPRSRT